MPAGLDGNPDPVVSADRSRMLALLADAVPQATAGGNVLVGIDGASGTGKSTLADELAGILTARRRPVVRASIDSFHRPRVERYARGPLSADGATNPNGTTDITATITWHTTWAATTGQTGDLGTLTSATTTAVRVLEAQAVVDY